MGGASGYPRRLLGSALQARAVGPSRIRMVGVLLGVGLRQHPPRVECRAESGRGHDRYPLGWQPSGLLADRAEAERAFALAERLGSINAAAQELGTTWPSLRKAFTRHGLGMPARNPEAVRQRAIDAACQRSGRPATPSLDPVFVTLNHGEVPVRARSGGELAERVRRAEDYAALGARVVVELHTESHAAKPSTRAWAITRRAQRAHRRHADRQQRSDRAGRANRTDRSHQPQERGVVADAR
jgi:hypothetical protein